MKKESTAYIRSLDDEIDWKVIDQLHTATSNFSSTSLELKKLTIILIGIAVPAITKWANDKLDLSLFLVLYIIILAFWYLDGFTYYYQEKLREKMDSIFRDIKNRDTQQVLSEGRLNLEGYTIEPARNSKNRLRRSVFHISLRLYIVLLFLNSIGLVLFLLGVIK